MGVFGGNFLLGWNGAFIERVCFAYVGHDFSESRFLSLPHKKKQRSLYLSFDDVTCCQDPSP